MTEIGESVAAPVLAGAAGEATDEEEQKCALLVRVKRPSGKGPWYAFGKLGGAEEGDDMTGHTFCAHIDEGGGHFGRGKASR